MCLSPSVEPLWQTPPFSPHRPGFHRDGENVDLHDLLSFSTLQRTETACAGEAKVFQEIALPDNFKQEVVLPLE